MGLDGGFGDIQLVGDLLVQQAIADHGQHPELLRRQAGQAGTGGLGLGRLQKHNRLGQGLAIFVLHLQLQLLICR